MSLELCKSGMGPDISVKFGEFSPLRNMTSSEERKKKKRIPRNTIVSGQLSLDNATKSNTNSRQHKYLHINQEKNIKKNIYKYQKWKQKNKEISYKSIDKCKHFFHLSVLFSLKQNTFPLYNNQQRAKVV